METIKGANVPIKIWAPVREVESQALDQLKRVAALPWVVHHVAVMPDVHVGKGATVGSVVAMRGAVAPAAVGVDIGCGIAAVRTSIAAERLPDSLNKVRLAIEDAIPVGFSAHDRPAWRGVGGAVADEADALMRRFPELDPKVQALTAKAARQLGTLGGGNHFIELCVDTADQVWLMLHSGSRNVGKELAEVHMARARKLQHNLALVDRDLAVFLAGTPEMDAYRRDLYWAQEYARINREIMLSLYQDVLRGFWPGITFADAVACHHNYVAEEVHYGESLFVTRKGAIRAGAGELGIIPGSMGTKSYIVRGRGNPEAFESASHGAGRRMSRGKAKSKYTVQDLREQTAGVECRKDSGVIDEIPAAYKPIDRVMEQQTDLVEIVAELKQVLCVKG
jgi:tRNA-splicing ligase RtcB (3'-phosphate/5'-hydroxy nucleic acid ligase)